MQRTIILYESKYSSMARIARILALILGPAQECQRSEFLPGKQEYDFAVLGSPVYVEVLLPGLMEFAKDYRAWLSSKRGLPSSPFHWTHAPGFQDYSHCTKYLGTPSWQSDRSEAPYP
jgi:menaquinone-dependent protoporphyrinogen IX oxidase